jgi:hypothetical protein
MSDGNDGEATSNERSKPKERGYLGRAPTTARPAGGGKRTPIRFLAAPAQPQAPLPVQFGKQRTADEPRAVRMMVSQKT